MGIDFTLTKEFKETPLAGRWFQWAEIEDLFWPKSVTATNNSCILPSEVRELGGIYFLAWNIIGPPIKILPNEKTIKYIGQTNSFRIRLRQFATSAGFFGNRDRGHSAGWRWPHGFSSNLYIALFPLGQNENAHIASGLRHWVEATALNAYLIEYGMLPEINKIRTVAVFSDVQQ